MGGSVIDIKLIGHDFASKIVNNVRSSINSLASTAASLMTGGLLALGGGILGLGTASLTAAGQFETMGVALETALNGNAEAAKAAQKQITEFAAKTPYELQEVMTGFVKLKNMGLDPSERALRSYGDTASAMGKSLNDMVEAVADAATGEFERLKEFGIRASQQGDKVTFTFKGVSTTVKKDSKAIEDYLIKLGETNFAGGMEKQSKTLMGTLATLKDTISGTLAQLAEDSGLLDVAKFAVNSFANTIQSINLKPLLEGLKGIYAFIAKRDFTGGFGRFLGLDEDSEALDKLFQIRDAIEEVYKSNVEPFFDYLIKNKDSVVFAFSAIATVILSTFVPAIATAIATALPIIATFAAIAAAAFFLHKAWNENFWGMRDGLINFWNVYALPLLTQIGIWLNTNIPIAIAYLQTTWAQLWPQIAATLNQAWTQYIYPTFIKISEFLQWFMPHAVNFFVATWNNVLLPGLQNLVWFWNTILWPILNIFIDIWRSRLTVAISIFSSVWNAVLVPLFTGLGYLWNNHIYPFTLQLQETFKGVGEAMRGAFTSILPAVKITINSVIDYINIAIRAINGSLIEGINKVPNVNISKIGEIPRLATGTNYVPQDMLAVIHKGEAVVPEKYNPSNPNATSTVTENRNVVVEKIENHYHYPVSQDTMISDWGFSLRNLTS